MVENYYITDWTINFQKGTFLIYWGKKNKKRKFTDLLRRELNNQCRHKPIIFSPEPHKRGVIKHCPFPQPAREEKTTTKHHYNGKKKRTHQKRKQLQLHNEHVKKKRTIFKRVEGHWLFLNKSKIYIIRKTERETK